MSRDKQIEEMANDHFAELGKMDKEKQIKEMAREIDKWYPNAKITNRFLSVSLYNAGYRKATEVIDEVVELLEELKDYYRIDEDIRAACGVRYAMIKVDELKKKYESEEK